MYTVNVCKWSVNVPMSQMNTNQPHFNRRQIGDSRKYIFATRASTHNFSLILFDTRFIYEWSGMDWNGAYGLW